LRWGWDLGLLAAGFCSGEFRAILLVMTEPSAIADSPDQPAKITAKGPKGWIRHAAIGFTMGSADVVPGVSGGTIAFVAGIYERLIDAIRDASRLVPLLVTGKFRQVGTGIRNLDFGLLIPLLAGIGLAVLSLATLIETALEDHPVELSSLFLGLVAGSVVVAWGLIKKTSLRNVAITAVSAVAFFGLLGLATTTSAEEGATSDVALLVFFGAGAIAICAMILPGISGSFLLVVMGMYSNVLGAVTDRDILTLAVFILGCATGILLFSRLLAYLMERHHDLIVAVLIGLMLGSLRVLWPWPDGAESTALGAPSGGLLIPVVLAAVGFIVVLALGRFGALKEEKVPNPG
jgi:putative membrane protein